MLVEVCVTGVASALAAERGGAHRLELCSGLPLGGLTPSMGLIRAVLEAVAIPVHILIRPREGDFRYDAAEMDVAVRDTRACREAGAAGVVFGALDTGGGLDAPCTARVREAAGALDFTFHRAFDVASDPMVLLEALAKLGVRRVLSSGQAPTAYEGRVLLRRLVMASARRVEVMPGGGVTPANVREIVATTGAREIHLSARRPAVRLDGDAPELPGLDPVYGQTDVETVRAVVEAARG